MAGIELLSPVLICVAAIVVVAVVYFIGTALRDRGWKDEDERF